MKRPTYIAALNVLGHLVLTKPKVAHKFLHNHGVRISGEANEKQLLDALIDLISENDSLVNQDLINLFASHLAYKGKELLALGGRTINTEEDEFLGGVITAATSLAKGIGGLFGAKKERKAQEEAHKRNTQAAIAAANKEKARIEAEARLKAIQMQMKLQQDRAKAEAERLQHERDKREREEAKEKTNEQQKWMKIGGVAAAVVFVLFMFKKNMPKPIA